MCAEATGTGYVVPTGNGGNIDTTANTNTGYLDSVVFNGSVVYGYLILDHNTASSKDVIFRVADNATPSVALWPTAEVHLSDTTAGGRFVSFGRFGIVVQDPWAVRVQNSGVKIMVFFDPL